MDLATVQLICTSVMILCALTNVVLLCHQQTYLVMSGCTKPLTLLAMVAYTLCSLGDISQMIVRYEEYLSSPVWSLFESHLAGANDSIYYIGICIIAFVVLLLLRIQTSLQLSRYIMGYLSLLPILSVICSVLWCGIMIYFAGSSGIEYYDVYLTETLYSIAIIDFALNLSLFILFVYKLRHKDSMEGMEIADDMEEECNYNCNYNKRAIWNVMIKHCVLFGLALVINELWYVSIILNKLTDDNYPSSLIRDYVCRSIENSVNLLVLFLVLKANNDKYICFCACCHSCILKTCLKEKGESIHEGFADYDKHGQAPEHCRPLDLSYNQPLLQVRLLSEGGHTSEVVGQVHAVMVTNDGPHDNNDGAGHRDVLCTAP